MRLGESKLKARVFKKTAVFLFILSVVPLGCVLYTLMIYFSSEKYSIALYHFNTQYLAGNTQAEMYIVTESLYNILLMYDKHPSWKFNVELSGSGLETIHDKYPSIYALLVKLINQGQLELILSPYSEQLSVAYTYEDMRRSLEIDENILKNFSLGKSNVLFLQEGQWHPAWVKLKKYGYDTFLIAESTLQYHGVRKPAPVLEYEYLGEKGHLVVYPDPDIRQVGARKWGDVTYVWRWANDGECANTDASSGRGAESFHLNTKRMKLHESRLESIENWGFRFIKISEWVEIAKSNGLVGKLGKFIPDATWQMYTVKGPKLWMGVNCHDYENDGYVRALCYRVRNKLLAVETLFNWCRNNVSLSFQREIEANITEAWKHLLLSEVSDSTGWMPLEEEVLYSLNHAELASKYCDSVTKALGDAFGFIEVQIFTGTGVVTSSISIPQLETLNKEQMPDYARVTVKGSQYVVQYYNVSYLNQKYYLAEVTVQPSGNYRVMLGLSADNVYYSPSLAENITQLLPSYPNPIYLPLSNGLIYGGGVAVIRNASKHHTAITIKEGKIHFEEVDQRNLINLSFVIKECSLDEALKLADIVNTHPAVILEVENG